MLYPDPTTIELASFDAEPQGRNVLVWWETAAEIDNVGFNIHRSEAGGEPVRLNQWLIPSQSPGSVAGFCYRFLDSSAKPDTAYQYWLEDIDLAGAAGALLLASVYEIGHLRPQVPVVGAVLVPRRSWQDPANIEGTAL